MSLYLTENQCETKFSFVSRGGEVDLPPVSASCVSIDSQVTEHPADNLKKNRKRVNWPEEATKKKKKRKGKQRSGRKSK